MTLCVRPLVRDCVVQLAPWLGRPTARWRLRMIPLSLVPQPVGLSSRSNVLYSVLAWHTGLTCYRTDYSYTFDYSHVGSDNSGATASAFGPRDDQMAGHNYISDPKNPFFSLEDDVDDETFLGSAPPRTSAPSGYYSNNHFNNYDDELERQHQQLVECRKTIEEKTIQSSERSISLLRDSEQIGAATAEELIRQREQLERTEKRLDDINSTLRFSQKHIQGIKSVFGSLRNYLSGKSIDVPSSSSLGSKLPESESCGSVSALASTIDNTKNSLASNHPALQRRGLLGDDEELKPGANNASAALERNLDEMSGSLARLKGLAIGLSEEIDSQHDLIESVTDKTETADIMLQRQNKEMTYLLKK